MRTIAIEAPSAPAAAGSQGQTYAVKVITPLFGGGTTPRKVDPVSVIRVPSVRGHLRWWYRAVIGRRYEDAAFLRESEAAIFGDTSRASKVDVRVKVTNPGRQLTPGEVVLRDGDRLFPVFSGDYQNVRIGVEFELTLRYPAELKDTMETVVWAWSNFGGIGAKTRRGCGALWIKEFAPRAMKDRSAMVLQGWSVRLGGAAVDRGSWPQLQEIPLARPSTGGDADPLAAWRACIEYYRTFRQAGPAAHGIGSFDTLGYAHGQRRMGSPVILRPIAWKEGTLAAPMIVPLRVGEATSRPAVAKVMAFMRKQHGFRECGEF